MSFDLRKISAPAQGGVGGLLTRWWHRFRPVRPQDIVIPPPEEEEDTTPLVEPRLKTVGYWSERLDDDYLIHPARLIDWRWHEEDRAQIITYLRNGIVFSSSVGWAVCRFPDGPSGPEMGCRDLTDGVWVWPEGLWLYVSRYAVRLPEEFVDHMRERGFDAFPEEDRWGVAGWEARERDERLRRAPSWTALVDSSFWREWAKKERVRAEAEETSG